VRWWGGVTDMAGHHHRRPLDRITLGVLLVAVVVMGTAITGGAAAAATADDAERIGVVSLDTVGYPHVAVTVTLPPALAETEPPVGTFHIDEDGEARAAQVTRLPGDTLEVVLVVDTSGSMRGIPLEAAKVAAAAFIAEAPVAARIGLVGFGDTPALASPLTTDRSLLVSALEGLSAAGETALYDAVDLAVGQFGAGDRTRRHVVVLSDGGDTTSVIGLDAAARRVADAGVRLDAAELTTPESKPDALASLARAGRGSLVSAGEPAALTAIYDDLGRGLANQYHITFDASGRGSATVRIVVEHAGRRASTEVLVDPPPPEPPTPTPAVADPAPLGDAGRTSGGTWALVIGAGLCFAALLSAGSLLLSSTRRSWFVGAPSASASSGTVTSVTRRAAIVADEALERHGRRRGMSVALERAGIALRPGELVVLAVSVALLALVLGALIRGVLFGLVLGGVTLIVIRLSLSHLAARRQRRFQEQLGESLQLMAGSLRTGYAVLQAIDVVAREAEPPASDEFRRVLVETRLGRSLDASLRAMADRVGGEDFTWVAQAIEINREVGGDLAEVLDNVSGTMRERDRVRRQVRAVSAEGRLSAYVLVALPLVLGGVLAVINPSYVAELTTGTGLVLSGVGAVMLAVGSLWISRMVKVDY
jgi:tight adherence protein B